MWIAAKFALSGLLGPAWIAKLIAIGSAVVFVAGAYLVWHHKVYTQGWNDHETAIAADNSAAIERNTALLHVANGCKLSGLRFDQTTRKCGGRL